MIKVIEGYGPLNKKLRVLGVKMRLELVLNNAISKKSKDEMFELIGCEHCLWVKTEGKVCGGVPAACRRAGIKRRNHARLLIEIHRETKTASYLTFEYCSGFEEKPDKED